MLEKIEYIEKNGKALVYRCYGEGAVVELPDCLRGLPVTELADHCFAAEPSVRYKNFQLQSIYREEWEAEAENSEQDFAQRNAEDCVEKEYPALCGAQIQELFLPKYLEGTGDYVFYGCLNLQALHIPSPFRRLGGGAFVACNKVRKLYFSVDRSGATPYCMKEVLAELSFELEVFLQEPEGKTQVQLIYPEYYEESVENTPARIIEIAFHGMGYRYRQCFKGRELDYPQYDALFSLTVSQEFLPTVMQLALDRLKTPIGLTEEAKNSYIEWLKTQAEPAAKWIFEKQQIELLYLLGKLDYFSEERLEVFLQTASVAGDAEAVSFLMDYRREHFAVKKKKKYIF